LAVLSVLAACVVGAFLLHVSLGGSSQIGPVQILREIGAGDTGGGDATNSIVWRIRLPRACAAGLVGALLASVGAAFQLLFRNPLAEPYVLGVSSGAALGGSLAIVLGFSGTMMGLGQTGMAFAGGLGSLFLVLAFGKKARMETTLLAGVVIGSMLSALLSMILLLSGQDSNVLLRWLLGSTSPMFWERVAVLAIVLAIGLVLLMRTGRLLNAFALGESTAARLGVDVRSLRMQVLIVGSAMTAAAVGTVGIIPFVGLAAPHAARKLLGPDARWNLPASALCGASLLLLADVLAQRLRPGMEIPLGAVTAFLGAPALLFLLRSRQPSAG
jgi:iron complex transport system permease protein